jgi:hypothetical protein
VWSRFDYVQEWVLREAAERGTEVHQAATAYIRGVYIKPLSVDRAGYFLSFKKWFESYVETVFATECRLTCETFGFTGKMDLVARYGGFKWRPMSICSMRKWPDVKCRFLSMAQDV